MEDKQEARGVVVQGALGPEMVQDRTKTMIAETMGKAPLAHVSAKTGGSEFCSSGTALQKDLRKGPFPW